MEEKVIVAIKPPNDNYKCRYCIGREVKTVWKGCDLPEVMLGIGLPSCHNKNIVYQIKEDK